MLTIGLILIENHEHSVPLLDDIQILISLNKVLFWCTHIGCLKKGNIYASNVLHESFSFSPLFTLHIHNIQKQLSAH
jgi:hypothetical protein